MSDKDWSDMTPRERDAWIAEWMGHRPDPSRCRICGWSIGESIADGCTYDNCSMRPPPSKRYDDPLPYTTDMALVRLAEDKIEQYGLQWEYAQTLAFIAAPSSFHHDQGCYGTAWIVLRSTPDQRCEAIWRMMQTASDPVEA